MHADWFVCHLYALLAALACVFYSEVIGQLLHLRQRPPPKCGFPPYDVTTQASFQASADMPVGPLQSMVLVTCSFFRASSSLVIDLFWTLFLVASPGTTAHGMVVPNQWPTLNSN